MDEKALEIGYEPIGGNGKVNIIVRRAGDVLALDKLDVLTATARARFAKDFAEKYPGIDREEVERQLLAIASEVQKAQQERAAKQEGEMQQDRPGEAQPDAEALLATMPQGIRDEAAAMLEAPDLFHGYSTTSELWG